MSSALDYKPLARLREADRAELIRGALEKLGNDEPLAEVAKFYDISYGLLVTALLEYAEEDWKRLQIARAHRAVQKANIKRAEIAALLDEWQDLEIQKLETPETHLTYARTRERLRIVEQEERSAQWHLERLHRKLYGQDAPIAAQAVQININLRRSAVEIAPDEGQVIDIKTDRD